MANPLAIAPPLHAAGAENSNGQSAAFDISAIRSALKLTLEITAITGTDTPTLALVIETSPSGAGSWQQVGAFPNQTAVGSVDLAVVGCRRYVRARWTLTGTLPNFTFALTGEAHQLLLTLEQAETLGLPTAALASVSASEKATALLRASDEGYGALENAYKPPITAWGDDVRGACADIFVFHALSRRGFNPEDAELIVKRKDDATSWLRAVANGRLRATGVVDATPEVAETGAYVVSGSARRW